MRASLGEYAADAAKAAPPISVSVATVAGLSLQEWVFIATLTYTVILIVEKLYKMYVKYKENKNGGE